MTIEDIDDMTQEQLHTFVDRLSRISLDRELMDDEEALQRHAIARYEN